MKKVIFIFAIIVLLFLGIFTYNAHNRIKVFSSHADFAIIHLELETVEEFSDYIVEAKYTGETVITPFPESGDPEYTVNLSKVEIKKVYKGELIEKETIWVSEPGVLKDDYYDTTEGYVHMNKKGKYILFLSEFEMKIDDKTVYSITGAHQGKYDLNIKKEAKHIENPWSYTQIKDTDYFGGLVKQYNDIKKEVVRKYGNENSSN